MQNKNHLVIYPLDLNYKLKDVEEFSEFLHDIKFAKLQSDSSGRGAGFMPGELFMRHLTFLGCSPSIGSEDETRSYNNYRIIIDTDFTKPRLISSSRTQSPVCIKCKQQEKENLASNGIRIDKEKAIWICPDCAVEIPVTDINWRYKLAVATDSITVQGVFEGEAIPADELLNQLAKESGINWSYCYC